MSDSIVIHRPRTGHAHDRRLLAVAILGPVAGALAFAAVEFAVTTLRSPPAEASAGNASVLEFPPRELPRELRWERKPIDHDHMFRQKESPRLDWIREGGAHSESR